MNRREILRGLSLAIPMMSMGRLYAAPAGSPRLLIVFLRGGYDCLNMLVPYTSDDYYSLRPNIAIPKPPESLQLDADWALSPALAASAAPLYSSKQLAFIPFAGTEDLSRSHFETQDNIELGQPADHPDLRSGFLARLSAVLTGRRAIAFTDSLPVSFRGGSDIPNISLKSVGKPAFDERQAGVLAEMYAHHPLHSQVQEGLELRQQVSTAMAEEMQQANRDAVTPKGFELEAQRIGRLLRTDYALGFVDIGSWDRPWPPTWTASGAASSRSRGSSARSGPIPWSLSCQSSDGRSGRTATAAPTTGTAASTGLPGAASPAGGWSAASSASSGRPSSRTGTCRCSTTIAA